MFRRPREAITTGSQLGGSYSPGRPPTPPSVPGQKLSSASLMASIATVASSTTPLQGRNQTLPKKTPATLGKGKTKPNGNILSFFKKAESDESPARTANDDDESLFLECSEGKMDTEAPAQTLTPPHDNPPAKTHFYLGFSPSTTSPIRYNEESTPVKRRKVDDSSNVAKPSEDTMGKAPPKGPFLDDSDEEGERTSYSLHEPHSIAEALNDTDTSLNVGVTQECNGNNKVDNRSNGFKAPRLKRESTSAGDADEFGDLDDFVDEEFPEEGEEYLERRWMESQAQMELELGMDGNDSGGVSPMIFEGQDAEANATMLSGDNAPSTCPICGGNTVGMTEQQVSMHVNDCLDGKGPPLSAGQKAIDRGPSDRSFKAENGITAHKRFQRAAIARPGQDNPFSLLSAPDTSSSAFSKLMSGHAEDNAWATAAATEAASRGKPAYLRTCPFYKIMPGFFICVDAFRYGAVEGCNAYFLSHFHSDHYIGLTSSWCHGPIYCSRVTANLVRRQLKVDPKWVVDLEFDNKTEVPNTQGVDVTMIPANHCPGSSLFLFEKVVGKGKTPKVQRVLHCGDFRACPAHVQHPKLCPNIVDQVSGKLAQQKLDVCYLDTTYLTPKYAFPSQEDVINACGDMCVSLSKDFVDENDAWEQVKKERAGDGMVKFVQKAFVKEEVDEDVKVKVEDEPPPTTKRRGRLLVVVGTYSIGKERICLGVAKALNSKIYAPPNKQKVVAALEDPELSARMTSNPLEAQVHMQMLMEIRAETLADYLRDFKPHFSRIVGFRPSGWNYRPPNGRFTESPAVQTVLHSDSWKSSYSMAELIPQRGSTREANCFGVPYSEHSSFRELTMFCCALRIDKIIPTVNVGSAKSRERMKAWCDKWTMEKKKNGLYKVLDGQVAW